MATLYANASGQVIGHGGLPTSPPQPPPNVAAQLDFDPALNAALAADLAVGPWSSYRIDSGALTRNGVPIAIATDASERDRTQLAAIRALLDADTAPTAAQLRVILRYILRRLG